MASHFSEMLSCGFSDPGQTRENNEDTFLIDPGIGLCLLCDGMGGASGGEVASQMAVELVGHEVRAFFASQSRELTSAEVGPVILRLIEESMQKASQAIYQRSLVESGLRGMGTTMTMTLCVGQKVYVGHVGDSRCYLIRGGETYLLTEDHSLFFELCKTGLLSPEDKATYPYPNTLSRALGVQPTVQVDTLELDLFPEDCFILCSDGLHGYLDEQPTELHHLLVHMPLSRWAQALVDYANEWGGKDNITVVAFGMPEEEDSEEVVRVRRSLEALQGLEMLDGLDYKEYIRLFRDCLIFDFGQGSEIIRQDDPGDALYVLIEGYASVLRDGQRLCVLEPGKHFGEMSLLEELPRSATVVADTECSLLLIERRVFERLLKKEPVLGVKLLRNLLRSMSGIVRQQSQSISWYLMHS